MCEFSRRAFPDLTVTGSATERARLRHDGYAGSEIGAQLAKAVLRHGGLSDDHSTATGCDLAGLKKPIVKAARLPGGLNYVQVASCRNVVADEEAEIVTDTLTADGSAGAYCCVTYNKSDKNVTKFFYLGRKLL